MGEIGMRAQPVPVSGTARMTYDLADDRDMRALMAQGFYLDSFTDATDDLKLTAAIAATQGATDRNMPAIILPCRPMSFTTPRSLFSGLKLVGVSPYEGQKNPDIASGSQSGPEVTLSGSIGSGTSSWWNSPGADVHDVHMANFQVQGSQGASTHQFIDFASGGSMYPCSFHSLSFNFMRGVFGRTDRKCLVTQMSISGDWTINNCWDTPIYLGGSDVNISPAMMNIGVASVSVQTGNINRYFMKLESLEAEVTGKIYISTMNGWRGLLISGTGSIINMNGGVYEGYKPTRIGGPTDLIEGPGPGTQVRITGGAVNMNGVKIGQGMDNPDASEDGLLQIEGGEVNVNGCNFYGRNMGTVNAIKHTGGRLSVLGATKRQNEGAFWSGRPKIATTATSGSGTYTYYCPDQSVA